MGGIGSKLRECLNNKILCVEDIELAFKEFEENGTIPENNLKQLKSLIEQMEENGLLLSDFKLRGDQGKISLEKNSTLDSQDLVPTLLGFKSAISKAISHSTDIEKFTSFVINYKLYRELTNVYVGACQTYPNFGTLESLVFMKDYLVTTSGVFDYSSILIQESTRKIEKGDRLKPKYVLPLNTEKGSFVYVWDNEIEIVNAEQGVKLKLAWIDAKNSKGETIGKAISPKSFSENSKGQYIVVSNQDLKYFHVIDSKGVVLNVVDEEKETIKDALWASDASALVVSTSEVEKNSIKVKTDKVYLKNIQSKKDTILVQDGGRCASVIKLSDNTLAVSVFNEFTQTNITSSVKFYTSEGKLQSEIQYSSLFENHIVEHILELPSKDLLFCDNFGWVSLWKRNGQLIEFIFFSELYWKTNLTVFEFNGKIEERTSPVFKSFWEHNGFIYFLAGDKVEEVKERTFKILKIKYQDLVSNIKKLKDIANEPPKKRDDIQKAINANLPTPYTTDLFESIKQKDLALLKKQVEYGLDVNVLKDGVSFISECAKAGLNSHVEYLLSLPMDKKLNINYSDGKSHPLINSFEHKDMTLLFIQDERLDLSQKFQDKTILEWINSQGDKYSKILKDYRQKVDYNSEFVLYNKRTLEYLGTPTKMNDGWDCGSLYLSKDYNTHSFSSIYSKIEGQVSNGDFVRISTKKSTTPELKYLYSSSGGFGYYDKEDENPKQFWKIQKVNLMNSGKIQRELYYGDSIVIENIYYPSTYLYSNYRGYCATSSIYKDEWIIVK